MLTWYIVSNGKVLAEYDGLTKALHYKYIYAGDQRIAMRDGVNRLHYYLNDHLGSARVVIDSTGTIRDWSTVETLKGFGLRIPSSIHGGIAGQSRPTRDCIIGQSGEAIYGGEELTFTLPPLY